MDLELTLKCLKMFNKIIVTLQNVGSTLYDVYVEEIVNKWL